MKAECCAVHGQRATLMLEDIKLLQKLDQIIAADVMSSSSVPSSSVRLPRDKAKVKAIREIPKGQTPAELAARCGAEGTRKSRHLAAQ